jgi:hypothetical protein
VKYGTYILAGVLLGLAYVLLYGGKGTAFGPLGLAAGAVALFPDRERVREALRTAFEARGLPGEWGEALGWVESRWRLGATNMSGPDGARGGAWGPTQITEKTARAYGYSGDMAAFTADPDLAAQWSATIMAAGHPATLSDAGAWWNAGRASFDALPPDHVTRVTYVPRLLAALDAIESGAV